MGVTTIRVVCGERVKGQFGFWVSEYVYGRWVSRQDVMLCCGGMADSDFQFLNGTHL